MPWVPADFPYIFTLTCGDFSAQVRISGSYALYDLAELLIEALGFDFDHAFGFYDNLKHPYRSEEKYTLFADMGEAEDNESGVKATRVDSVFSPGKRMCFLFDYGDGWEFEVCCDAVEKRELKRRVRKVLSRNGEAPEQYPDWDEEM